MASAQVLPSSATSSRKQEHLEAGKRRLEEFRKKKAAERTKKAASTSQLNTADAGLHEKQLSESELVRLTDSDGAVTSDGVDGAVIEPSGVVINNDIKESEFVQKNELDSSYGTHVSLPFSANNYYDLYSGDPTQTRTKDKEFRGYDSSESLGPVSVNYSPQEKENNDNFGIYTGAFGRLVDRIATEQFTALHPSSIRAIDSNSSQNNYYGLDKPQANNSDTLLKDFAVVNPGTSNVLVTNLSPESSGSILLENKSGYADSLASGPPSSLYEAIAGTNSRRSRPSFLDSINMPRVSSASLPIPEEEKASFSSKVYPMDVLIPGAAQNSMKPSAAAGNGGDPFRHGVNGNNMERKNDFYSQKQDEDFAGLEQHIEDLTQEKFSLQRALEASRALAESLATENSALTDSYNQQGSVVNQLKSDMEKLQEEIKAQLVELESVKIEYANAQLECNAADERAKLLASEVIGLEEKALRLRSSELKLERQLENSQAEISSFKKKMSSLERERQDLQSTIDALQEEKKLLQSKLRKASASGKLVDVSKSLSNKKDTSTSTEDLVDRDDADATPDTSNQEMHTTALRGSDASNFSSQPQNRQLTLEGLSLNIPPDQMRMIQSINTLISELALEKEELMQALLAESSQSSELKEWNKELSQKLEAQTQRLELLTAQSMVNNNIPARQPDSRTMHDNTSYADEGDEVVERVLGWIMKLFPGGPSRRRTSKRL